MAEYDDSTGDYFTLMGQRGVWMDLAAKMGFSLPIVCLLKAGLGGAWLAGVLDLWAGDGRAYPLVLLAAAGTLLVPGGPMVMAVFALIVLLFFRESPNVVPA